MFEAYERLMEMKREYRYTVSYEGYLFYGDKEGDWNYHGYNRWQDVQELINAYGNDIHVTDNEYGVSYDNGEWW